MARTNCWLWREAFRRRRLARGRRCYRIWRWSDWCKTRRIGRYVLRVRFPHFLHGELRPDGSMRLVSFKPVDPALRWLPPLFFEGRASLRD